VNLFDRRLWLEARSARLPLYLAILSGFAGGALVVLQAARLSGLIGRVFLRGQGLEQVSKSLQLLLLIVVGRALTVWLGEVMARIVAVRVKAGLRERLFAHLLHMGPVHAWEERTGELTAVLVDGVEALDAYFSQYLPQLALSALVPITILVTVFPLDPLSGVVLSLTAPLIPVFMVLIGRLADDLTRRQWGLLSALSAHFLDILQGLRTLKTLGRSREQADSIARASERFAQVTMGVLRVAFLSALVLELVSTLSTAVLAVEVGLRLLYGRLIFEDALFILILAPEFYLPLRALGARFHAGLEGLSAAERIYTVLDTPVQDPDRPSLRGPGPDRPIGKWRSIQFLDVRFAYQNGGRPALRGATFRIPAGQKVALVGPSGAGKSTIASLLLRFIHPQGGLIRLDDRPLNAWSVRNWRGHVAWLPQRPYLFNDSIGANIRLARPDASMEAVARAAQRAELHGFIQSLPRGYDTPVGERGLRLSSGQARRLALARAFLKDAPLILLDEPTASVDPGTEDLLRRSLERLLQGRTALIIAHRLPTVYRADWIVVLSEGRVVAQGTHIDLVTEGGLYRDLVGAYGGT
jgi:ATP-binding cassette subfamily C protein CydD